MKAINFVIGLLVEMATEALAAAVEAQVVVVVVVAVVEDQVAVVDPVAVVEDQVAVVEVVVAIAIVVEDFEAAAFVAILQSKVSEKPAVMRKIDTETIAVVEKANLVAVVPDRENKIEIVGNRVVAGAVATKSVDWKILISMEILWEWNWNKYSN